MGTLRRHFTDSMPISSIGGIWSANHKYASHLYKVTVAVDMLATLYGFAPWPPGHQPMFWDRYGPSRTRGDFFDFEVGGHDGAYKGRIHVVPFIGRKNGAFGVVEFTAIVLVCNMLCTEGVQSNVVDFGGFSMRG